MIRLIQNQEVLDQLTSSQFRDLANWIADNLLNESVMSPENWMEVAFHLNKQRWDSAIDWLENQPMSKIKLMMEINKKTAEDTQKEMKSRRRK